MPRSININKVSEIKTYICQMRHVETDYLVQNLMKMLDPGPRSVSLFTKLHHASAGTYKLTLSLKNLS
jgi:hypothetical protein